MMRRFGRLIKTKTPVVSKETCRKLIFELLNDEMKARLEKDFQLDFSYELPGVGRFRGSAMQHNNGISAAFRIIPPVIPPFDSIGLPEAVKKSLDNHQGLILVTGATGQGKTTTLASMVDHINSTRAQHVLTVEDPVEFIHPIKKGVVNQRQLGEDTLSYANSLKAALREDPDVIMIGELRDLETISLAISAAETGHLVLGTLATKTAPKTVDRIIDSFPSGEQTQIRAALSETLKAVITQRLIPGIQKNKMELAVEILIGTLPVASLIRDGKVFQIPNLMQTGKSKGMRLMDESIMELVKEQKISLEDALPFVENKAPIQALIDKAKVASEEATGNNPKGNAGNV
jgi:twitching motility protein PilT